MQLLSLALIVSSSAATFAQPLLPALNAASSADPTLFGPPSTWPPHAQGGLRKRSTIGPLERRAGPPPAVETGSGDDGKTHTMGPSPVPNSAGRDLSADQWRARHARSDLLSIRGTREPPTKWEQRQSPGLRIALDRANRAAKKELEKEAREKARQATDPKASKWAWRATQKENEEEGLANGFSKRSSESAAPPRSALAKRSGMHSTTDAFEHRSPEFETAYKRQFVEAGLGHDPALRRAFESDMASGRREFEERQAARAAHRAAKLQEEAARAKEQLAARSGGKREAWRAWWAAKAKKGGVKGVPDRAPSPYSHVASEGSSSHAHGASKVPSWEELIREHEEKLRAARARGEGKQAEYQEHPAGQKPSSSQSFYSEHKPSGSQSSYSEHKPAGDQGPAGGQASSAFKGPGAAHYQTLGVPPNASKEEINKAYKRMAMKHHPDRGGDVKTFQAINEAHQTLTDPVKKYDYDLSHPH